jgi:predicted TIM-barrel fold metal-dependent hydrolase
MIIDSHTHVGRGEDFSDTYQVEQSLDLLLQQMAECGIDRSCVMPVTYRDYEGGHREVREAVVAHPDKFTGYARANLNDEGKSLAQVRRCFEEWDFRGVKVHPWQGDGFPTRGLMELLAEYERPLLVHTQADVQSIDGFVTLARAYPRVPVILGHMGGFGTFWPGYVKLCAVEAKQIDNLCLDTARVFDHTWIRMAVDICGPEKVLFGTDACAAHPAITLKQIELCAFSDSERELITGGNAERLLKL